MQNAVFESADADKVANHRKQMNAPREDLIAMMKRHCNEKNMLCCCGPFEADWQLIGLKQEDIIDHVASIDG